MQIFMLHTVPGLAATLTALAGEESPGTRIRHFVDESLLADTIAAGSPPAHVRRRVVAYTGFAQESGAEALLVTCSSLGDLAEDARRFTDLPVLRIDEPMCREAVRTGPRVGVLATLPSTLGPTARLVRRVADNEQAECALSTRLCEGAFEALRAGRPEEHDTVVVREFRRLAEEVDVVVLAQASMARIVDGLPREQVTVPVLASPRSGVAQLRGLTPAGTSA